MRTTRPSTTTTTAAEAPAGLDTQAVGEQPTGAAGRPANRAERRAARRGRTADHASGPVAPRNTGPTPHAKPAHIRTDFAARRSG